jgi:hypothetical protein
VINAKEPKEDIYDLKVGQAAVAKIWLDEVYTAPERFPDLPGWNSIFSPIDVPGSTTTRAFDINPFGAIVGWFENAGGAHGFLDIGGTFSTLDVPGAINTPRHWYQCRR